MASFSMGSGICRQGTSSLLFELGGEAATSKNAFTSDVGVVVVVNYSVSWRASSRGNMCKRAEGHLSK